MHCDCSTYDSDGPEFSESRVVKAGKNHICCECRGVIKKGEQYERVSGKWDGYFDRYKTCLFCLQLRRTYCPRGWVFGELRETIEECLGFDYTSDPADWDDEPREPEYWQLSELRKRKLKEAKDVR